jgi:hypothetical protein
MSNTYTEDAPFYTVTVYERMSHTIIVCTRCYEMLSQCITANICGRCPKCNKVNSNMCIRCKGYSCTTCTCARCGVLTCMCHLQCEHIPAPLRRTVSYVDINQSATRPDITSALENMHIN